MAINGSYKFVWDTSTLQCVFDYRGTWWEEWQRGCILLMKFQFYHWEPTCPNLQIETPLKGASGPMVSHCYSYLRNLPSKWLQKRSDITSCSICGVINWKFPSPVFYEHTSFQPKTYKKEIKLLPLTLNWAQS